MVDVSVPGSPIEVGCVDTPGAAYAVAVAGDHAYVADEGAGLRVIDIRNPCPPTEVGSVDTPGAAYAVAVSDDYAYVADYYGGVRVIDVTGPTSPWEVGSTIPPAPLATSRWMTTGVPGGREAGVLVLDISTPDAPVLVGSHDTPRAARGLALADGTVVLADYYAGVAVFDDCRDVLFEDGFEALGTSAWSAAMP